MSNIRVYKFGGASIRSAELLQNIVKIVGNCNDLVLVVSAIDKTTNKLELLVDSVFNNNKTTEILEKIKNFHFAYIKNAFTNNSEIVANKLNLLFDELEKECINKRNTSYNVLYDKIVSYGELLSTTIISEYLKLHKTNVEFIDIRDYIVTDTNNCDAKILWDESQIKIDTRTWGNNIFITQGFIGRDKNGIATTLGREGSDYTASAIAYLLNAIDVTIWKDVPGIMNADPAWYPSAEKLDILSFGEAIELAFFGAKVIHPKTIKPIENKNIPLYVKCFNSPYDEGTIIKNLDYQINLIPTYILKHNQILLSISPKDFSFIVEENISKIFGLFAKYKIKVNITQNSAISLSVSIDGDCRNFDSLVSDLSENYFVKYNTNLELITIRYYDNESIQKMTKNKNILLEQRSRKTARFVLEADNNV